jgi:bacterioferritin-associated ferredoxin
MTENVEEIQELIREDHRRTIHELADTTGINYGVCQEILSENLNKHRTAPPSRHACPHVPVNQRVCDSNMVIVPHPPYSPDLAPRFHFVSHIENETDGTF